MDRKKSTFLFVILIGLFLANYGMARAKLLKIKPDRTEVFRDEIFLPKHTYLQMIGLNYNSFTSSMVWLSGLLYYGSYKLGIKQSTNKIAPPNHLGDYAKLMVNIDPRFKSPFEWYTSVFLYSRKRISAEDIEQTNAVLDIAIKYHPTDYKFPYMAGLNYIGYSAKRDPRTRIKELNRAIAYLEHAAQFDEAPDFLPFTIAKLYQWKERRQKQLKKGDTTPNSDTQSAKDQRKFYLQLYNSTIDDALRMRLAQKLIQLGVPFAKLQGKNQNQMRVFKQQYNQKRTYLPLDLWVWIENPILDVAQ